MRKNITIGDKVYQLQFDDFDEEMDIDNLLRIDHSNLVGEMVTFPVFVNRFGNLLAEAESKVAEVKLNLEITEAKLKERLKAELQEVNGGKNPTVDALNNAVFKFVVNIAKSISRKLTFDNGACCVPVIAGGEVFTPLAVVMSATAFN